jgi:glycosyltransferase involved in cell wall biosynthesis
LVSPLPSVASKSERRPVADPAKTKPGGVHPDAETPNVMLKPEVVTSGRVWPAVLQVSTWDEAGARFDGLEIHRASRRVGARSSMAVSHRSVADAGVFSVSTRLTRRVDALLNRLFEERLGFQRIFATSGLALFLRREFWTADAVHLQIIHGLPWFSLLLVPLLSRIKPLVWTWHDPWIFSGHCIHPLDCELWKTGCGHCPDLSLTLAVPRDSSAANWKLKRFAVRRSKGVIVVASEWMKRRVEESGMAEHLECRVIPFGVDTTIFRPRDAVESRRALGIEVDAHVVAFRDRGPEEFKNSALVVEALRRHHPTRRTYVLCFESSTTARQLAGQYEVIDLGWVASAEKAAGVYSASDLFLMPSRAEAFGLMAVEAMACGVPVIVAEGTSLPRLVNAPHVGVSVPQGDGEALAGAIGSLLADPDARRRRGEAGRDLAVSQYSFQRYLDAHLRLYEEVTGRRSR